MAGDAGGFVQSVQVAREGEPWLRVACRDDVDEGVLTLRIKPLDGEAEEVEEVHRYDPLTGARR